MKKNKGCRYCKWLSWTTLDEKKQEISEALNHEGGYDSGRLEYLKDEFSRLEQEVDTEDRYCTCPLNKDKSFHWMFGTSSDISNRTVNPAKANKDGLCPYFQEIPPLQRMSCFFT